MPQRQIQNVPPDEVLSLLGSAAEGLTNEEAARRLKQVGPNVLSEPDRHAWLKALGRQLINFFTLLLLGAAGICAIAHQAAPDEGMDLMGWALSGVALLNALFAFVQEYRAERAMQALLGFLPQQVTVLRAGHPVRLTADQLVPGDVIEVGEGDRIAADARLLAGEGLSVDNAPLTGESRAMRCRPEASDAARTVDADNVLFAGCSVLRGSGRAVVFATGRRTEFGRIAMLSTEVERAPSPLERETAHMVRVLTAIAVGMGVAFFVYGLVAGRPLLVNLVFMMGIIVANVPEGLLPTFTLALAMGSTRMAKRQVLVKSLGAVETLGAVQVVCTDKTGTLTRNDLRLTETVAGAPDADGAPRACEGDALRALIEAAYLASETKLVEGERRGDPLDVELAGKLEELGARPEAIDEARAEVLPFDVNLRRAGGRSAERFAVKGAWMALRPMIARVEGEAADEEALAATDALVTALTRRGKRVIAVASRPLGPDEEAAGERPREALERDLDLLGLLCLEDPLRPQVPDAVAAAKRAGVEVIMVTGDHPETATEIARQAGIVEAGAEAEQVAMTGQVLEAKSRAELEAALEGGTRVFARTTPAQKMKIVQALQGLGKVVAMTGDGVNDAPALRAAELGIAMGKQGTDVAREAAQIVLLDDDFASIVAGIQEGRTVFANIQKFTNYVLVSNGPEILPYILFILFPVPLALTVIQILSIDLGTDIVPSMALGREPPEEGIMDLPPRSREESLLSFRLIAHSYFFLGLLEAAWSLSIFAWVMAEGGWRIGMPIPASDDPTYQAATGAALSTILLMQIGNLIGRRSRTRSGLDAGLFRNPLIVVGILVQIVFSWAVLYWAPLQTVLATGPVDLEIYAFAWLGVPLIWGADYLRKRVAGWLRARGPSPDAAAQ
ncbi:MAG TPA: cation-transporting P-type ATPase [Polyangiaceae bacterium LLY-WYZ-15_(1-7)]|nr:cation-transporting P-type ATPase [Polyangiaceae bacterium LLY-WYZ-15_(1-7)]HJL12329.1 cation-transporting P-type ATPase [Polyangiaceae bacterium LLY-WYZ-15_(1-7)]HJL24894.1 cation-transporting P-type ATPase [Polyangiaceae bacterium LLY-WYZ-15_(1-7)]